MEFNDSVAAVLSGYIAEADEEKTFEAIAKIDPGKLPSQGSFVGITSSGMSSRAQKSISKMIFWFAWLKNTARIPAFESEPS